MPYRSVTCGLQVSYCCPLAADCQSCLGYRETCSGRGRNGRAALAVVVLGRLAGAMRNGDLVEYGVSKPGNQEVEERFSTPPGGLEPHFYVALGYCDEKRQTFSKL